MRRGRALPRRAAGPRGDDRQPGRQCLQMGAVAGRGRGRFPRSPMRPASAASCASWSTTTARACRPPQREQVARRGRRLDETKPGSGLGLSIVVELAALYGGGAHARHRADRGPAGGAGAARRSAKNSSGAGVGLLKVETLFGGVSRGPLRRGLGVFIPPEKARSSNWESRRDVEDARRPAGAGGGSSSSAGTHPTPRIARVPPAPPPPS